VAQRFEEVSSLKVANNATRDVGDALEYRDALGDVLRNLVLMEHWN
jgi:hypothetical protein